jgi:hypothetical protein
MMNATVRTACVLAISLGMAVAAEISGKWAGDRPGRGGDPVPTTFTFKVDGDKVTGTMTAGNGEVPLQEGRVSGNQISFSTTFDAGGNSIKILFKGTVEGDQIKMTSEREGSGQARQFTIKRAAN